MGRFSKIGDVMVTYLDCIIVHEKSRTIEFVFNNSKKPILHVYPEGRIYSRNFNINIFSIMSRYGRLTDKQLKVYRAED